MHGIIAWSMQYRLVVLVAALMLIVFGITQLRNVPVDVLPEFSRPYVEIQTEALGLSADEVEAMITVPLEADMLNGVPWVDEIRSSSIPGLSSIVMIFEPDTDMLTARQVVQERLVGVHALPNVSKPPAMLQPVSSANRFMAVGLGSDTRSLIELSVLARWTIVPRLMGVPGVAQVSIWGQRKRQLQVQVNPVRLSQQGVTLQQVVNTTGNALWMSPLSYLDASTPGTGGWIETPNQRLGIQHLLPISTPADLAKVTVEGTTTPLGQLATVVEDHQPLIGDALVNDAPSLMLVIEKFPWANTIEVTQAVEEAIDALQLGLPGVSMDSTIFRPATYLELALANLSSVLMIGAALVLIALLLASLNWRKALISAVAVLVSAMAAVAVLLVRGVTVDMMVLAGLMAAFLVLIDDAVVDIQNIARRLAGNAQGEAAEPTARTVLTAAAEMRRPLAYATVVIALALVPFAVLDFFAASFSHPIIFGYGLAVLASFLTALTLTPVLSVLICSGGGAAAQGESSSLQSLQRSYAGTLEKMGGSTSISLGVAAVGVLVIVGLWLGVKSNGAILPTLQERDIVISVDGVPGTSEHAMRRAAARLTGELRGTPGVRSVSAHVGRAVMSDRINDINSGEVWVSIDPEADYDVTLASVRETVAGYPGFDLDVDTYLGERVKDEEQREEKLTIRVYGEDVDKVGRKAEEVRALLAGVDGLVDPEVQYPDQHPNLEIEVKLEAAKQYGLTPGDVRRTAATLLSGLEVGSLFEDQKVFDVVVWGTPEVRHSLNSVKDLLIDLPTGGQVALRKVADTRIVPKPTVIRREAVARHIDVEAEVEGRAIADIATDVTNRIRGNIEFPLEYRAEVLGDPVGKAASQARVTAITVAVVIGIFLLLQAAFGSWSLAFFVLLAMPVALLGGLLTSFLFSDIFALGSVLGLFAVFALFVRNSMTLMAHYRDLRTRGEAFSAELVYRGTRERFEPVVATAVVAALAFLPVLFFQNIAGLEILFPMAIAVLGGLVTSTLVILFVVPGLYVAYGEGAQLADVTLEETTA